MAQAWIGLGSNLDDPINQVTQALAELDQLDQTHLVTASQLWQSQPVGPQDQPDFINAVALIETQLAPLALLHQLQSLEQAHRRVRERHWGPRTLDLDLLAYEQQVMQTPELTLPHPRLYERAFVLKPWAAINPACILPPGQTIQYWLDQLPQAALNEVLPLQTETLSRL
ncbi:2-amino-4-hydroxy-6-hydroxymethyldihydropteridine diphosphokinase [Marinospirillum sp. MEB164]|uniref:2-amino-4-hydroxy-6-hydroxymethyldihydropteridine pyrophosphokinase n=1 Tax=Marinospirillum alkalitolerans TaxID=3123374 RepID=A0ABW8PZJ1_9GAMM